MIVLSVIMMSGCLFAFDLIEAFRGKRDIFCAPCLIGPMFMVIHVFQALLCQMTYAKEYLQQKDFILGQLVVALAYVSFVLGWHRPVLQATEPCDIPSDMLKKHGLFWLSAGLIGWAVFLRTSGGFMNMYGTVHGSGADWEGNTAYLYQMILFAWPGLILLILAAFRSQPVDRNALITSIGFSGILFVHSLLLGDRGDSFRTVFPWLIVPFLVKGKRPRVTRFVMLILLLLIWLVFLVTYRRWFYLGADRSNIDEASVTQTLLPSDTSRDYTGTEYLLSCARISYSLRTFSYGGGIKYCYPIINVIPRLWWPSKPYRLGKDPMSEEVFFREYGWAPSPGSAQGGVSDIFVELSVFSFLIWFLLGKFAKRLYVRSVVQKYVVAQGMYVSLILCLFWLINSECLPFFDVLCYFFLPFLLLSWKVRGTRSAIHLYTRVRLRKSIGRQNSNSMARISVRP